MVVKYAFIDKYKVYYFDIELYEKNSCFSFFILE